jgi:hypothetical protein
MTRIKVVQVFKFQFFNFLGEPQCVKFFVSILSHYTELGFKEKKKNPTTMNEWKPKNLKSIRKKKKKKKLTYKGKKRNEGRSLRGFLNL